MRGRREPGVCQFIFLIFFFFSQREENAILWEREEDRPQEQAARSRAVAATTNRCGWESPDKCCPRRSQLCCLLQGTGGPCTPKPAGGNCSLCFLSWGGSVVWFLDQLMPCGRSDVWAPSLYQCGSGMSNREGVLLSSTDVTAPGSIL